MKGLCRNPDAPEVHLSHSVSQDVAARFVARAERGETSLVDRCHRCVLSARMTGFDMEDMYLADLRMFGCDVDCLSVTCYSVAYILGVHFRAGEWGQNSCGSVITTVVNGRSLYARVNAFVRVDDDESPGYALVSWFSEPTYPFGHPLVVRVTDDGSELDRQLGSAVRITCIDPSKVMIDPDGGRVYYMMRDSGYDTVRT